MSSSASVRGRSPLEACQFDLTECPAWRRGNTLDRDRVLGSNPEISQILREQLINHGETPSILPQELDHSRLAENPNHIVSALFDHDNAMGTPSKRLNGSQQTRGMRKRGQWVVSSQVFHISQRDGASLPRLPQELLE